MGGGLWTPRGVRTVMPRQSTLIGLVVLILVLGAVPAPADELRVVGEIRSSGPATTKASKKIVSRLRGLIADFRALNITRANAAAMDAAGRFSSETLKVDNAGRVQVYVFVTDTGEQALGVLRQHGLDIEIVNQDFKIVQGWVPVENLESLAGETVVTKIRPPSYGRSRTGMVNTEGDAIHRCDQARGLGFTGAGVKIGVISNGVDGLASSQASGDLPAVQVLFPGAGDEGTAMLEIIYDCAPGATFFFSSGFPTSLDFINSVNALRNAGANIIVDDIGFYGEPFFGDGTVGFNHRAVGGGVLLVSSAGNDRLAHYQAMFAPGVFDPQIPGTRHNFGGGDTLLRFSVPANRSVLIVFQWGNPFGGAGDDYDVCVRQTNGTLLGCSAFVQDGNDDPIEALGLRCTGPPGSVCSADIQITLFSGSSQLLEMFCVGPCQFDEFNVPTDSIFGHPAVPEALAIAASPAGNPSVSEPFSSMGPSTVLFSSVAASSVNSPSLIEPFSSAAPEVRATPGVTGIDGVATTRPGFHSFFGTSAAAPHVAGVAALLAQANPSYQLSVFTHFFREALKQTAVDLGPPGPDPEFGSGRADALNAVQNELGKARCEVLSSQSRVSVGQPFTLTINTFPGTGDPWDIYVFGLVFSPGPFRIFSLNFATASIGPENLIQPARPTAPMTASSQSFTFTVPSVAEGGVLCIFADPGLTRINRFSFVPMSITP